MNASLPIIRTKKDLDFLMDDVVGKKYRTWQGTWIGIRNENGMCNEWVDGSPVEFYPYKWGLSRYSCFECRDSCAVRLRDKNMILIPKSFTNRRVCVTPSYSEQDPVIKKELNGLEMRMERSLNQVIQEYQEFKRSMNTKVNLLRDQLRENEFNSNLSDMKTELSSINKRTDKNSTWIYVLFSLFLISLVSMALIQFRKQSNERNSSRNEMIPPQQ